VGYAPRLATIREFYIDFKKVRKALRGRLIRHCEREPALLKKKNKRSKTKNLRTKNQKPKTKPQTPNPKTIHGAGTAPSPMGDQLHCKRHVSCASDKRLVGHRENN
jgi:hypothetical protein